MSEIEKILKDVVYGGIGAIAKTVETGTKLARNFVQKGREVCEENEPAAREWLEKAKDACKAAEKEVGLDLQKMSRAMRDELAAQLKRMADAEDAAAAEAAARATAEEDHAETCTEAAEEQPDEEVEPDEAAVDAEVCDDACEAEADSYAEEEPAEEEPAEEQTSDDSEQAVDPDSQSDEEPEASCDDWMKQISDACKKVEEAVGVNLRQVTREIRDALAEGLRDLTSFADQANPEKTAPVKDDDQAPENKPAEDTEPSEDTEANDTGDQPEAPSDTDYFTDQDK